MAIEVQLPVLHPGQIQAFHTFRKNRFTALRAGRRWGKTDEGKTIAADRAIKGGLVGWFAPDYKRLSEAYHEIVNVMAPVLSASSKVDGVIRTITGGRIDFWTLEDESAGRSRKYHLAIIDEAAFTKPNMMDIWRKSIQPTLLDYKGKALVMSNTNGIDSENFFWRVCNEPEHGFVQYHAPSRQNPYLPAEELERLERETPPLVWQQEYLAEFVDWSGAAFFSRDKLLVNDQPVPMPATCDSVFAVIDSATKTGKEHDGTAVGFFARDIAGVTNAPLTILDWDIVQIEGDLLVNWLPSILRRLEELARQCNARSGSVGIWIEDKNSGSILNLSAQRRGWPVQPIDTKLTGVGKEERALAVSGYVHSHKVKIALPAFEKTVIYKEQSRNHFMSQVTGFRMGDRDPKRQDDLLDVFCYGIALALGDLEGI